MPLTPRADGRITRITNWYDEAANPLQVSVAVLDPATWEVLAHATEQIGPFHPVQEATAEALRVSRNLAAGQYAGQGRLLE